MLLVSLRLVAAAAATACLACASAHRFGHAPPSPRSPPLVAPERIDYGPGRSEQVLERAVEALQADGRKVLPPSGPSGSRLVTAPVERDAPCGVTNCLVREVVKIDVGYRRAKIRVERQAFESIRDWEPTRDPTSAADIKQKQQELAATIQRELQGSRTGAQARKNPSVAAATP